MSADTHGTDNTEPDNTNVGLIAAMTVMGAFLVFSIILALTALVRAEQHKTDESHGRHADLGTVAALKEEQHARLNAAPAWEDKAEGIVAIPIDRAMELVAKEISTDPNAATPYKPGEEPKDEPDGGADGGATSDEPEAEDEGGEKAAEAAAGADEAATEAEAPKKEAPAPGKKAEPTPAAPAPAPAPAPEAP